MKDNCISCSKFVRLLILAFLLALVSACGGGSSNSAASSNEQVLKTTTGVAQKGPFSLNSPVVISRLDSVGNPTGDTISTKISTKTGGFEFEIPEQWGDSNNALINYYIEVQGKAFDESSGTQSSTSISLTAYTQNINSSSVNLLTHWHAERAKQLLAEGKSFKQSIKQANDELVKLFGIDQINSLDISSSEFASDSAMLLLLSGALMDVARAHEVEPQLMIDEISDDFSSDGELSASGDHWFIRMQALIRDNPSAHANKYSKLLKEKQAVDTVAISNLPVIIPLASRPVANVPSELLASPSETIVLDGSASHDSGNIINFTWFRVDQQTQYPVPVSDRFAASPTITVPNEAEVLAAPNQEIALLYALVVTDEDKLTHTGAVKVIIKATPVQNTPPVAESQQLSTDEDTPLKITLAGSDNDGDPISFNLNTPLSIAHGIIEVDPDFGSILPNVVYTPTQDYFGSDSFTFLVNDGFESSNIATVDIQVNPVNDPPLADADVDQTVESSQNVTLNGLGSTDVDGTVDGYSWQQQLVGSPVSLNNANVSNPSFTAPFVSSVSETLMFDLIVTDNDGADSIADTVNILVNPLNEAPVANAGVDQDVISGDLVTLNGSGTDVDGDVVGYSWTHSNGSVSLSNASIYNPIFTAPTVLSSPETFTFDLIVTDDDGAQSVVNSVDVVVNPPTNLPPTVDNLFVPLDLFGNPFAITLIGNDPDGNNANLIYEIVTLPTPSIGSLNVPIGTLTGNSVIYQSNSASSPDPDSFTYRVTDELGLASNIATVNLTLPNIPPTAIATFNGNPPFNELTNIQLIGSESYDYGTGLIVRYLWEQIGTPVVLLNDPNAENPTFTAPSVLSTPLTLIFRLTVTDNDGAIDSDIVDIEVVGTSNDPIAYAGPDRPLGYNGESLGIELDGSASSDPNNSVLTYSWERLTSTANIYEDNNYGQDDITTPQALSDLSGSSPPATVTFRLTVTNTDGLTDTDDVIYTIQIIPFADYAEVCFDDLYSTPETILLTGRDPDGDDNALRYKILSLPNNGSLNMTIGEIIGNEVIYTPPLSTTGLPVYDSFTFSVIDEQNWESLPEQINLIPNIFCP